MFWLSFAVVLRLIYFGLLRPGEGVALRRSDITLPSDASFGFGRKVVMAIRNPKTRATAGRSQFAVADDEITVEWTEWLAADVPASWKLFPGSLATFGRYFRMVLDRLGCHNMGFSPAGLRGGGATRLFLNDVEVSRIRFLGRWRDLRSLEHYLQE